MKVKLRLDPVVAEQARRDVAEGRAGSIDEWLNDAARAKVRTDELTGLLADLFEHTGGPLTAHEITAAREQLTPTENL